MMELDFFERLSSETALSRDDQLFLDKVGQGIRFTEEMPLKTDSPGLPNNEALVLQRLKSPQKRFSHGPKYMIDYVNFMNGVIEHGYAEVVDPKVPGKGEPIWHIPHHGVYHPKKPTKIRVVFDCSAKYKGKSLNDTLLQGPDLANAVVGVFCRFRLEPVGIMCDIEQMFFQFEVREADRDFLRLFWWPDCDVLHDLLQYRMTVHLFWAASSPECENFGLKQTADDIECDYGKAAADFVRDDFYVDGGLKFVPTVQEAVNLVEQTKLCAQNGLHLHKFVSNSTEVLRSVPECDQANLVNVFDINQQGVPVKRALGVHWCVVSETFQFHITVQDKPFTSRGVLSTKSSVFDPFCWLANSCFNRCAGTQLTGTILSPANSVLFGKDGEMV